jgi:hypothetical protein
VSSIFEWTSSTFPYLYLLDDLKRPKNSVSYDFNRNKYLIISRNHIFKQITDPAVKDLLFLEASAIITSSIGEVKVEVRIIMPIKALRTIRTT